LLEWGDQPGAGIVHEDIQAPKPLHGGSHQALHLLAIGDIGGPRPYTIGELALKVVGNCGELLGITGRKRHLSFAFRESARHDRADAGTGSGDKHHTACKKLSVGLAHENGAVFSVF
jgi:hypothetical protein